MEIASCHIFPQIWKMHPFIGHYLNKLISAKVCDILFVLNNKIFKIQGAK